jgi:hypothetical protein
MTTLFKHITTAGCLMLCGATIAATDPALQGCWRGQHARITLADNSFREQNGDCVVEYEGDRYKSRCHGESGLVESVFSHELIGSGRLKNTLLDTVTFRPKGAAAELSYRIDGRWLMVERVLPPTPTSPSGGMQPVKFQSMMVRVKPGESCAPFGEQGFRIARGQKSSIAMHLPVGWKPLLVDPSTSKGLSEAINHHFFIGAFVQLQANTPNSGQIILLMDDTRYGPSPVRSNEFLDVKKQYIRELDGAQFVCDEPDRVCSFMNLNNNLTYTELLIIKGRVVNVTTTTRGAQSQDKQVLRESVRSFVDMLRTDNAE